MRIYLNRFLIASAVVCLITILVVPTEAQYRRDRRGSSRGNLESLIRQAEERSNSFRRELDRALDQGRLDGSRREDRLNERAKELEDALDRLRRDFDRDDNLRQSRPQAERALQIAEQIDTSLRRVPLNYQTAREWARLRETLIEIARAYEFRSMRNTEYDKRDVEVLLRRVEQRAEAFRPLLDRALDRSQLDGTNREDRLNEDARQLDRELGELRRDFNRSRRYQDSRNRVARVLDVSKSINKVVRNRRLTPEAERAWGRLRDDLNFLAYVYNLEPLNY